MWPFLSSKEAEKKKEDEMFSTTFNAATKQTGDVPASKIARDREEQKQM